MEDCGLNMPGAYDSLMPLGIKGSGSEAKDLLPEHAFDIVRETKKYALLLKERQEKQQGDT